MLNWLTERTYNRFDVLWITWAALAIRDKEWFALFVALIGGVFISAMLEAFAEHTHD